MILALLVSCSLLFPSNARAFAQDERAGGSILYLPLITSSSTQVQGASLESCVANDQEARIGELLRNDEGQKRAQLTCNPTLAAVARAKAKDMASRSYFDHTNPDGAGPNLLLLQAGFPLPANYSQARDGNNIESIAAGFESADYAWSGWLNSDHHRPHVLGEVPFFAQQTEYGVGYYYDPNSFYHHYWVILTAHAN